MAKFNTSAIDYIKNNNLTGVRAGKDREKFLEIWMVTVRGRIFARSWGFSEKSWYHTFLSGAEGAIKCGEEIVPVKGIVPDDIDLLTPEINQAYLTQYDTGGDNSFYAKGIIEPEHIKYTMEFVPV